MAKGKKGPALFEVIRAAQQRDLEQRQRQQQQGQQTKPAISAGGLLKSPVSWFKGKQAAKIAPDEPVMREVARPQRRAETTVNINQPIVAPPSGRPPVESRSESRVAPAPAEKNAPEPRAVEAKPATPAVEKPVEAPAVQKPVEPPLAKAAPRPVDERPARIYDERVDSSAAETARRVREEIAASSRQQTPVSDRDAIPDSIQALFTDPVADRVEEPGEPIWRRLPQQINYYTAGIAAGIVLVAILLVYLINHNQPDRNVAIRSDVLEVRPTGATVTPDRTPKPTDNGTLGAVRGQPADSGAVGVESVTPIKVPTKVNRIVGQQYIVLVSVPAPMEQKEHVATDLVKYLADNGVAASVEQALPGYSPSWVSVVTAKGFDRTRNNPEYDQYAQRLTKLMEKFSKGSKFVKSFKLDTYTWRLKTAAN
jgi:hypothetical protein